MADSIRIRMYRVGFGDCFLITLPGQPNSHQILIDCGVHSGGDIGTLDAVMQNLEQECAGKLDLIVATHMHRDHIAGFDRFRARFSKTRPGEIWLPWTEDPNDANARALREQQATVADQIKAHFAVAGDASPAAKQAIDNLTGNANAIDALHNGFDVGAQVRYLRAGDSFKDAAQITGLSVDVLGPPTDPNFLGKMDPPASQRYLRAASNGDPEEVNAIRPFLQKWQRQPDAEALHELRLSAEDRAELRTTLGSLSMEGLAFALDNVMNNTSLVLLCTFGGRSMLFAGDAQYGNWRWWLDNRDSAAILSRIAFLKVAHHGSVNATPRDAVERLGGNALAMVSTQTVPWKSIPRLPLMTQLQAAAHQGVVRSDSLAIAAHPDAPQGPALDPLPAGVTAGALWYDYTLDLV